MNVLGGSGYADNSITATLLWASLMCAAAFVIVVALKIRTATIGRSSSAGRSAQPPVQVVTPCDLNGHLFRLHHTGWRCSTCGEGVFHEHELADLVQPGGPSAKHHRRRPSHAAGASI